MKNNLVSIIIPIYNSSSFLRKTLESIVSQTYKEIEVILINDGSTDNSKDICDEYCKRDKRFKLFNQKNMGVCVARNKGMDFSKGKYIIFMDSDDWIENDYLEILVKNIIESDADVCISNFYMDFKDHKEKFTNVDKIINMTSKEAIAEMLKQDGFNMFLGHLWNKMFSRKILNDIYFDNSFFVYEDTEFVYRALKKVNNVIYIPYAGYHYIQRATSTMNSKFSYKSFSSIYASKKILDDIIVNYDKDLINIGVSYYIKTNLKQAALCTYYNADKKYIKEIRINIKNVRKLINLKQIYTKKDIVYILLLLLNCNMFIFFYNFFIKKYKKSIIKKNEGSLY